MLSSRGRTKHLSAGYGWRLAPDPSPTRSSCPRWGSPDEAPRKATGDEPESALLIRAFRNTQHPNGGVINYRLERNGKSLVMATDIEGTEGEEGDLVDFAQATDLLIEDAQYTPHEYRTRTKGWGHLTWEMAVDVAQRANVGRLVLFHHDPSHDDSELEEIERTCRERFPNSLAACEGLEITL